MDCQRLGIVLDHYLAARGSPPEHRQQMGIADQRMQVAAEIAADPRHRCDNVVFLVGNQDLALPAEITRGDRVAQNAFEVFLARQCTAVSQLIGNALFQQFCDEMQFGPVGVDDLFGELVDLHPARNSYHCQKQNDQNRHEPAQEFFRRQQVLIGRMAQNAGITADGAA